MPKDFEFGNGLGSLDSVLRNQSVSDLSWLAVDEEAYRAAEALPKQNLDIIPELTKAMTYEDDVPHIIPMRPHVIVNRNPLDRDGMNAVGIMDGKREEDKINVIRNRVAKMVMQGLDPALIKSNLECEFAKSDLRTASTAINEVVGERGLLGNVYINAAHFPRCTQSKDPGTQFGVKNSRRALFVLAKDNCAGCVCNRNGQCSSLKKTIVASVPYNSQVASHYMPGLAAEGRVAAIADTSSEAGYKQRLQMAFLSTVNLPTPDGVKTVATQHKVETHVYTDEEIRAHLAASKPVQVETISPAYAKFAKRMMEGRDDREMLVASGDPDLVRLASEFGLLGHVYLDMDAFGGCDKTLRHIESKLASDRSVPDFVVRRTASCPDCHCAGDGACSAIGRHTNIVTSSQVITKENFMSALERATQQGRISASMATKAARNIKGRTDFRELTAQLNTYAVAAPLAAEYSGSRQASYAGSMRSEYHRPEVDGEEIRRSISHFMNMGLTGSQLKSAILSRYASLDLGSFRETGMRMAAEEGVQGSYYIDPTAYADYGAGCQEGSKTFRKRGPLHIMASSSCSGCTLQSAPGWCSRYAKTLVDSVPNDVRVASQRRALPVVRVAAENPVEKYELSATLPIDLNGSKSRGIEVAFGDSDFGF